MNSEGCRMAMLSSVQLKRRRRVDVCGMTREQVKKWFSLQSIQSSESSI